MKIINVIITYLMVKLMATKYETEEEIDQEKYRIDN